MTEFFGTWNKPEEDGDMEETIESVETVTTTTTTRRHAPVSLFALYFLDVLIKTGLDRDCRFSAIFLPERYIWIQVTTHLESR